MEPILDLLFDVMQVAPEAFTGNGRCPDAELRRADAYLFLVHMGTVNLWWTHQPCWVSSTESQSGWFNSSTFRLSVHCKQRPGNLDTALLQIFASFPLYF